MAHSKKERAEYNERRERTSAELGINKNEYNRLRRVGQALSRHDTDYANGATGGGPVYHGNKIVNRYEDKQHTKDVGKAFSKTKALKGKGIHYHHQTDPRGAALYASKEKLNSTNYNQKGRVIY